MIISPLFHRLFQLKFIPSDRFSFAKRSANPYKILPNLETRLKISGGNSWQKQTGGGACFVSRAEAALLKCGRGSNRVTVVASVVGSPLGRVDNTPTEY